MVAWTRMVVIEVARSLPDFKLEPVRCVDAWLWQVSGIF